MITNHNLSFLISGALEYTDIGPGSRVLQFASFSFDASVFELSLALSTGSTICMAKHPKVLIGDYLADVIDENQINFIQITPSVLGTLPVDRKLSSLRQVSIGGEAPSGPLLECWSGRVRLVNDYGPTETA
jgi:non-ribosomal peptide synthetase component F